MANLTGWRKFQQALIHWLFCEEVLQYCIVYSFSYLERKNRNFNIRTIILLLISHMTRPQNYM